MASTKLDHEDDVLKAINLRIEYHQSQLDHLLQVRELYLGGAGSQRHLFPDDSVAGTGEKKASGISTQLIDAILEKWPTDKEFSSDDLFQEMAKSHDLTSVKKRNASALICSILSRRIKQGKVVKCDRGAYRKTSHSYNEEAKDMDALLPL